MRPPDSGRRLILVDGRSGSGKSTITGVLAAELGAAVIHTDDIAWWLHPVAWDDALVDGVLKPWSAGQAVRYRPPGWIDKGRPGHVEVPADARVLIVEGVGAGRARLAAMADRVVWVQADRPEARRRGIERDMVLESSSRADAEAFWEDWASNEDPFIASDQPWTRADLVVNATPEIAGLDPHAGTWVWQPPAGVQGRTFLAGADLLGRG